MKIGIFQTFGVAFLRNLRGLLCGSLLLIMIGSHASAQAPVTPFAGQTAPMFMTVWNDVASSFGLKQITLAQATQAMQLYSTQGETAYVNYMLSIVGDFNSPASTLVNAQVANNTIQTSIFQKAEPAVAAAPGAPKGKAPTAFGADAFYNQINFDDGGGKLKTYGTNLSLAMGDTFQFRGTLPIYRSDFGGSKATTYGLDLNGKYRMSDSFSLGAHGNYMNNKFDGGSDSSWTGGVYAAALARASEASTVSFGVLFDRIKPKNADATWLGAVGVNWGIGVGKNVALNPYGIYYRNLNASGGGDKDWFDLGAEIQTNLSETWAIKFGAKSSLGQDGIKSNYQVYIGSSWRF